ncbi:hypothetical protein MRB53_014222 [Persea americana]|uniref:Uncharacterized protein n=1 Tax=Persea americana TaxID=3435 RepID=A0ACC2KAJ9_PERAE|nr:hypothetical protein MRB53_014222 [Persea americana]
MASLSTGQQGILSRMTEMFDQLAAQVEQIAAQTGQESGDNSRASGRGKTSFPFHIWKEILALVLDRPTEVAA